MPQGFNFIAVVQNRIGSVIRFAITTSVACSVATVSNWIDYRSYWNGTIYSTQTVDFNILSHILPTKLSYVLQKGDVAELQKTIDSNYGFFGLVVTDCKTDNKDCLNQRFLYFSQSNRTWKKQLNLENLPQHPYDLLRNPPPLFAEGEYDSPHTKERSATGKNNTGQIIGRVYYIRGIPPSFLEDYLYWIQNPLNNSEAHKYYSLTMTIFLLGGCASWVVLEFVLYKRRIKEELHEQALLQIHQQYKKLMYQFKEQLKRNEEEREKASFLLLEQEQKFHELHKHNQQLRHKIDQVQSEFTSQVSNHNQSTENRELLQQQLSTLRQQLVESEKRESQACSQVDKLNLSIHDLNEELEKNTQRITILEQQSSQLDSLNAFFISLEPDGRDLSLAELQQELGLEQILTGGIVTSIFYSDRYLNSRGARTLADLLQGNWLISSHVTIKVLENRNQQPAPLRKNELEQSLTKLTNAGIILQVKVQHSDCPDYFDHARLLEISMDDGKSYKLLFDQGMDFIEFNRSTQTYRVRVPTYVTLTNPGNGVFAINYRFIYSASQ